MATEGTEVTERWDWAAKRQVSQEASHATDTLEEVQRVREPVHHAQILTYLRRSGKSVGLLFNFNVDCRRDGIVRRVLSSTFVTSVLSVT